MTREIATVRCRFTRITGKAMKSTTLKSLAQGQGRAEIASRPIES
jgi:hypothetical protein